MNRRTRSRVLVVDRSGWRRYETSEGHPIIDPDRYEVTFLTTGDFRQDETQHAACTQKLPSEAALWEAAKGQAEHRSFDRLVSVSEHHLLPAAMLRDEFGIAGPGVAETIPFRDKVTMKDLVRGHLPTADYVATDDDRAPDLLGRYPTVVLKPRRGAGSANILRIDDPDKLDPSYLARRDMMIEEWIDGDIIHVDSVVRDWTRDRGHRGTPD